MQRQSNKFRPQFTDEECITVYLWGISQRRFEQRAIYNYTKNHLSEWFPKGVSAVHQRRTGVNIAGSRLAVHSFRAQTLEPHMNGIGIGLESHHYHIQKSGAAVLGGELPGGIACVVGMCLPTLCQNSLAEFAAQTAKNVQMPPSPCARRGQKVFCEISRLRRP